MVFRYRDGGRPSRPVGKRGSAAPSTLMSVPRAGILASAYVRTLTSAAAAATRNTAFGTHAAVRGE
jgi:hypothetical protein